MRTIIAGSRDFNDYDQLVRVLPFVSWQITEVVSGRARGADALGERWAKENNIPVKFFPADWNLYGKRAGYRRNEEMAQYGQALVAFWDGQSRGTRHMIDIAQKKGLRVHVHMTDRAQLVLI